MHHGTHARHCGGRHHGGGRPPFGGRPSFGNGFDPRGGSRGRSRMFDGGELRLLLLSLIADAPRHGYDLIRAIEEMTGGAYAPSPGIVYPTLTLLAEMEFVAEQASDDSRKRFAATDAGRAHLAGNREAVDALLARLKRLGEDEARQDGAPIRRSMANLSVAVRERLGRGGFSEDTMHDVAALIDAVAQKIERLK